jgi:hypothetical protein
VRRLARRGFVRTFSLRGDTVDARAYPCDPELRSMLLPDAS